MRIRIAALASLLLLAAPASAQDANGFAEDFHAATEWIGGNYAYFGQKRTQWNEVPALYADDLRQVRTRDQFVRLLEQVVDELHDPHAQLNTNLRSSYRLVPSGTDLWAEWRDGKAIVTEVRAGSDAQRAGIEAGSEVVAIDGVGIERAVDARMGRSYPHATAAARGWALRSVLAGTHDAGRRLTLRAHAATRDVLLPAADQPTGSDAPLDARLLRPGIGYIRINDSLGDQATVAAFDAALAQLRDTRALVIDLRDTPSGGNSSVARGILGRFVARELPYQKHVLPAEERETGIRRSWLELVSPRGEFRYPQPVAVLVDHWTGSMGEGLAIGFDATDTATIIGTPMAGLQGATEHLRLANTGIGINLPTERLYHVDGTPREAFIPRVVVDVSAAVAGGDPFIAAALQRLDAQ